MSSRLVSVSLQSTRTWRERSWSRSMRGEACMPNVVSTDSRARLRGARLRVTPQRVLVLEILEHGRHLDAMAIHQRAAPSRGGLSLATVDRTLSALTEAGLGGERRLDLGHRRG